MVDNDIASDADHWLFAEDLMNFVFRHQIGFPASPIGEECRGFVREGFSETVRRAVEITERKLARDVEAVFYEISAKSDVIGAYTAYVSNLRKACGYDGFDGNKFLHYCVFAACLGERFYRTGAEDFHYLSFTAVREAVKRYDASNGGWGTLELVADAIISVEENSSPPESGSTNSEQSTLVNEEHESVTRTWSVLHEHNIDCSSEGSVGSSSAGERYESSDSEGSVQSIESGDSTDTAKESEGDSGSISSDDSSKYLVTPAKKPPQSDTVSSSTEISKFHESVNNYLKAHRTKTTVATDIASPSNGLFLCQKTELPLDFSKRRDQNESCSKLHRKVSVPGCSGIPLENGQSSETSSSKNMSAHLGHSDEPESTQEENRTFQALSHNLQEEQLHLKRNLTTKTFESDSGLPTETRSPNSTESTDMVVKRNDDNKPIS